MKHFSAATIPKSRNSLFTNLHTLQVTCCHCWSLSYSTILCSWANSLRSHVIPHEWTAFYSTLLNIYQSGAFTVLAWLVPHETAAILACSVYTIQPCTMSLHAKCEYHSAHSVFWKGYNCSDPMLFWYRREHMQRILILLTPSERPPQHAQATDSHSTYSFGETSTTCICNGFSFYLLLQRDQHNMHMQRILILLTPSERPAQRHQPAETQAPCIWNSNLGCYEPVTFMLWNQRYWSWSWLSWSQHYDKRLPVNI